MALSDLADEFEKDFCAQQVSCGLYPDVGTCREVNAADTAQMEASVAAGRATYDADKAGECLDAIVESASCEPVVNVDSQPHTHACDELVSGNVELGNECFDGEECAGLADCAQECGDATCCSGTCVAVDPDPDHVEIGSDCSEADCVDGAWCKPTETAQTCEALGGEGDACIGFSGCGADLACNGFSGAGTCYRPAKQGQTCDPQISFGCARSDNYCDAETTVCTELLAVGASCEVEGPRCVLYATCVEGTCAQDPGLGDSCVVDGNVDCLGDLECRNGTCQADEPDTVCP